MELVGYSWEGDVWCTTCFEMYDDLSKEDRVDVGKIYDNEETECVQYCRHCGEPIKSTLIGRYGLIDAMAIMTKKSLDQNEDIYFSLQNCYTLHIYFHHYELWFDLLDENTERERIYGLFEVEKDETYDKGSIKAMIENIIPTPWDSRELYFDHEIFD